MEKLRTLGYPTVPTYHLDLDDVNLHEDISQTAAEGKEGDEIVVAVPESIATLQKRLSDWCSANVREI